MSYEQLPLSHRLVVRLWWWMSEKMMGFPDPFVVQNIETLGLWNFLRMARLFMGALGNLEKRFGLADAQILIGCASVWSGCRWCGVGHIFAGNVELYHREGILGPLDELRVPKLQEMRDSEVLAELLERFSGPRWEEIGKLIERQYLLRSGQLEPETHDDHLLELANHLWQWVNECSIVNLDMDPLEVPAQSPINKKKDVIERYRKARRQAALGDGS